VVNHRRPGPPRTAVPRPPARRLHTTRPGPQAQLGPGSYPAAHLRQPVQRTLPHAISGPTPITPPACQRAPHIAAPSVARLRSPRSPSGPQPPHKTAGIVADHLPPHPPPFHILSMCTVDIAGAHPNTVKRSGFPHPRSTRPRHDDRKRYPRYPTRRLRRRRTLELLALLAGQAIKRPARHPDLTQPTARFGKRNWLAGHADPRPACTASYLQVDPQTHVRHHHASTGPPGKSARTQPVRHRPRNPLALVSIIETLALRIAPAASKL